MDLIGLATGFFSWVYDVPRLIELGGYLGLAAIIFSETGLMVGFFLPGESLLITAGLFAATGRLDLLLLNLFLIPAAIIGDAVGYAFGSRMGRPLYDRPDSFFFRRSHLIAAKEFYEKHGGKAIVLARFFPFVRTFAPIAAGVAGMPYSRFAAFNVVGAVLWVISGTLAGYFLGRLIPDIERWVIVVAAVVIAATVLPVVFAYLRRAAGRRR